MSLAPSLYNFQLSLSQVDRNVTQELTVKLARHPSELMERVWLKLLAFCWQWEERLEFGPGLGDPDAPDLVTRDYTGVVTRWIRVGKADPVKLQRAVDQNAQAQIVALFESPDRLESFLAEARIAKTARLTRAELAAVDAELLRAISAYDERRAKISVTFVGDHFYLEVNGESFDGPLVRGTF